MASDRRQKKLINISVQRAVALRIVTHSILFVWSVLLVCAGLLYITSPVESSADLERIRTICLTAIGVATLVILPAIVYDSIKFSHRMAGPVERLKNLLPLIGVEHVEHVGLRKNDFWQDFAVEFNAMLDRIEALRQAAAVTPASVDPAGTKIAAARSANFGPQA